MRISFAYEGREVNSPDLLTKIIASIGRTIFYDLLIVLMILTTTMMFEMSTSMSMSMAMAGGSNNRYDDYYKFVGGRCQRFLQNNVLLNDNLNPVECFWANKEVFVWKRDKNSNRFACYKYHLTDDNLRGKRILINKRTRVSKERYHSCILNKTLTINTIDRDDQLKELYNEYTESILHNGETSCKSKRKFQQFQNFYQNAMSPISKKLAVLDWSVEELIGAEGRPIKMYNFYNKFKNWMVGDRKITSKDLALRFASTENNDFDVFRDHDDFWPELVGGVEAAKSTINIQVFGLQADPWGWEFGRLLAKKARSGVKVKILADRWGARMTALAGYKTTPLIDFLEKNGVEVVLSKDIERKISLNFDHRKCFIIDGKTAYNTGYTIENHMRHKHFDVGIKATGDIVKQMQASFLLNFSYFGMKKLSVVEGKFSKFMSTYFPEDDVNGEDKGHVSAKLNINVPRYQHPITENYYNKIWNAKKSVWVINPYFSDKRIIEALKHAASKGVKVHIITPNNPENILYKHNTKYHYKFLKAIGAETLLYDGPEKEGWLHAKGIVIDENIPSHCFASFGSTNMDAFALYHDYEQNIETSDQQTVRMIKAKVFDYARKYSHPYEPARTVWGKFKQGMLGGISETLKKLLNPRPYRYRFTEEKDLKNVAFRGLETD